MASFSFSSITKSKSNSNSSESSRGSRHFRSSDSLRSKDYKPWRQSSPTEFEWKCDNDGKRSGCDVQVISRDIGVGIARHVALYFDWGWKQAIYESGDENGYLIPFWSKEKLENSEFIWVVDESYHCSCSPKEVNREAIDLERSGRYYDVAENNCYWWAMDLAKKFGIKIDISIWAALSFIPGVPALIDWGLSSSKTASEPSKASANGTFDSKCKSTSGN